MRRHYSAQAARTLNRYDRKMEREVAHVGPAEVIREIAAILDRVDHGAEVIVEKDHRGRSYQISGARGPENLANPRGHGGQWRERRR
jgi:hypothetical protein